MSPQRRAWAVILAGGDGTRLAALTSRDGKPVPKQYCALSGPRTLLRMALDRAERLVPASRTVTVVQPLTSSGGSASSEARSQPAGDRGAHTACSSGSFSHPSTASLSSRSGNTPSDDARRARVRPTEETHDAAIHHGSC